MDNHDIHTLPPTSKCLKWQDIQMVIQPLAPRRLIWTCPACHGTKKRILTHWQPQVSPCGDFYPKMSSGCRFPLAIFFTPTHLSSKGSHSLGRVIVQFPPSREHALLHGTKLARSELNYPSKESLCYWVDGFVAAKKDVYSRKMEGRCRQFKIRR